MDSAEKALTAQQNEDLLALLKKRFESHMNRHEGITWFDVVAKLESNPKKLWSINEMENTGGEPDVIGFDITAGKYLFCDCSAESPHGRRNLCYDQDSLIARKKNKPQGSAMGKALSMGIQMLTESEYRSLQELEAFDLKTSSWIVTPPEIRRLGGALFCDRRYDHVFTYHNGADSYYGARGFRGLLRV